MTKLRLMTGLALFAALALVASDASAQANFEVTAVQSASAAGATEVEFVHDISSDDGDRVLLAFASVEGEGADFEAWMNDTEMIAISNTVHSSSETEPFGFVAAFYLLEADLPDADSADVYVASDGGDEIHLMAVTIHNALQEAPTGASNDSIYEANEVEVDITTVVDLCLLIDLCHSGAGDGDDPPFTAIVPGDDQTPIGGTTADSSRTRGSRRYTEEPAGFTNFWEYTDDGNRLVVALAYVKAADGAVLPPPPEANQGPTEVPTGMPVGAPLALGLVALILGATGAARARRK